MADHNLHDLRGATFNQNPGTSGWIDTDIDRGDKRAVLQNGDGGFLTFTLNRDDDGAYLVDYAVFEKGTRETNEDLEFDGGGLVAEGTVDATTLSSTEAGRKLCAGYWDAYGSHAQAEVELSATDSDLMQTMGTVTQQMRAAGLDVETRIVDPGTESDYEVEVEATVPALDPESQQLLEDKARFVSDFENDRVQMTVEMDTGGLAMDMPEERVLTPAELSEVVGTEVLPKAEDARQQEGSLPRNGAADGSTSDSSKSPWAFDLGEQISHRSESSGGAGTVNSDAANPDVGTESGPDL